MMMIGNLVNTFGNMNAHRFACSACCFSPSFARKIKLQLAHCLKGHCELGGLIKTKCSLQSTSLVLLSDLLCFHCEE